METSQSLLQKAKDNPQSEAWFQLVRIYEPLIAGWVVRAGIEQSSVGDITQEVFQTMSRELVNFDHNGKTGAFRNWLKTTAINRCRRHWDVKKREVSSSKSVNSIDILNQLADPVSELSALWDSEHDHYVMERILNLVRSEFDTRSFSVFVRNAIEGESPEELSKEFGIAVGHVYKIKFRVIKRLREEADELVNVPGFFKNNIVKESNG
jgi:RNA polymerase sigma factor (sigma-70 family)